MKKNKIMIIEDEAAISDLLEYGLQAEGYLTRSAPKGKEGIAIMASFKPDILLLDWMLPDMNGLEVCKQVTEIHNIPIVMITAKADITDIILGLEFGADDYITKPFDMREVKARIRTVFRRVEQANRALQDNTEARLAVLRFKDIEIRTAERSVSKNGNEIELTPKEYDLLLKLYTNRGIIFSRAELLEDIWGYDYAGDTRTVDTHVQRLRKKLELGDSIVTVFSVGYKFNKQVGV